MKYRLGLCAGILFFSCLLFGCREKEEKFEGTLTISFITIGKGDAFLIETPDKNFYIWDTGKKRRQRANFGSASEKGSKRAGRNFSLPRTQGPCRKFGDAVTGIFGKKALSVRER